MDPQVLDLDFLIREKEKIRCQESQIIFGNRESGFDGFQQPGTESNLLDLALILSNKFTKQKTDSDTQQVEGLEDFIDLLLKSEAPPEPVQLKFDINEECLNLFDDVNFDSEEEKVDWSPTLENELGEFEFSLDENINAYPRPQKESKENKIEFNSNLEEIATPVILSIATPVILSEELHNETQEEENKAIDSAKESENSAMPISSAKKTAQLNTPNEAGKTGENEAILSEPTDTKLEPEVQKPENDFTNVVMDEHDLDQKDESEIPVRETDEPSVFSKKVLSQGTNETQKSSRAKQQTKIPPSTNRLGRSKKRSFFTTSFSLTSLIENTKLLGLDIGSNSLKYVILKKTTRGLKLIDCGMRSIAKASVDASEQEKRALIARTIRKKFKIQSVKNTLVTSAVSGLEVLYQNIQVPKMARKELAKAVPWACRKDFPFPIDATTFEYQIIDHTNGKFNIFVEAAQKDLVTNHVQMLQKAKIVPAKVSTVPVALWNLFRAVVKKQADTCHAVIDIGGSSSHIVFINHGQLLFAREISTAGDDITHALTGSIFIEGQEINVSPERAERFKRKYGILDKVNEDNAEENIPLKEISVMMAPVLERLVKEIQRTIDFFKEKFNTDTLEKIFLTGGSATIKNLTAYFERELNTTVEILNPFDTISTRKIPNQHELHQIGPRFAVAVGLAIDNRKALNLLPKELKGAHTFQNIKKIFKYVFVILVLLMILLSQNVKSQLHKIENDFKRTNAQYNLDKPKRQKFVQLQNTLKHLKSINDLYEKKLDINSNAAQHLKVISNLIPANIALTSFRINYRKNNKDDKNQENTIQEVVILDGVAFQNNSMEGINLAKFLLALEKSSYFYAVSLKYQKIREDGNLQFTIECEI